MKKFLSFMVAFAFALSLVPVSVFASDYINVVQIFDIDEPIDSAHFDRFAEVQGNQPYDIVSQPEWYDETDKKVLVQGDTFKAGHIYTVKVQLEASDGYEFKTNDAVTSGVIGHINAKSAGSNLPLPRV